MASPILNPPLSLVLSKNKTYVIAHCTLHKVPGKMKFQLQIALGNDCLVRFSIFSLSLSLVQITDLKFADKFIKLEATATHLTLDTTAYPPKRYHAKLRYPEGAVIDASNPRSSRSHSSLSLSFSLTPHAFFSFSHAR